MKDWKGLKTIVRCPDRMCFPVDPKTLEPLRASCYDAYCFSDPEPGVTYIELSDWNLRKSKMIFRSIK